MYCCDVLEHVDDLDRVMAETARVPKPGGVYLFDTTLHDWDRFVRPEELQKLLSRHDLHLQEVVGLWPRGNPFTMLRAFAGVKHGTITYGELGRTLRARAGRSTRISYMGYALKEM